MANNVKLSWAKIHKALHDGSETVEIDGKPLKVILWRNGCRCVEYKDTDLGAVTIMEQNKNKSSEYAKRAKAGETLSWVIPYNKNHPWVLIDTPVQKEVAHADH